MDVILQRFIESWRNQEISQIMVFFTFIGSYLVLPFVSLWSVYLRKKSAKNNIFWPAIFLILSATAEVAIKNIIQKPRPFSGNWLIPESGYSFPSGHAMNSTVAYGILAIELIKSYPKRRKEVTIGFGVLVFLIGISRIYLGVHYPSDVLGGWVIGGIILFIYYKVVYLIHIESPKEKKR